VPAFALDVGRARLTFAKRTAIFFSRGAVATRMGAFLGIGHVRISAGLTVSTSKPFQSFPPAGTIRGYASKQHDAIKLVF
jgi:hypothetical protein